MSPPEGAAAGAGRPFRLRRRADGEGPGLTPLIDVVFLLLTFFVLTPVLLDAPVLLELELPELAGASGQPGASPAVVLIDEAGGLRLDGEPTDPEAAARELAERDGGVLVGVDVRAPSGPLIALMDAMRAAGVRRYTVVGVPASELGDGAEEAAAEPGRSDPADGS